MLKRYVDNKTHLQLEVLYAFQIAVAKIDYPPSENGEKEEREGGRDRLTDDWL